MIKSASRSSITNDQKYRSMLAGTVPSSEYLIESRVVGTATPTIEFNNLSQFAGTYKHLQIVATMFVNANQNATTLRFNGDMGTNYAGHWFGSVGAVDLGASPNRTSAFFGYVPSASTVSAVAIVYDILDAFSSTKNKTMRGFWGQGAASVQFQSSLWINTSPVSSIAISSVNNFAVGSRFSLYGVTA